MKHKKILKWLPFLLVLFLILFLTLQNSEKSGELSNKILEFVYSFERTAGLSKYGFSGFLNIDYNKFRKLSHTAEYFLLGLSCMFLFRKSPNGFWKALALCAVISLTDQCVKLFVPGREFDWTDFPYDIAGYLSGAIIVLLFRKKGPDSNKTPPGNKMKDPSNIS